MQPKLVDTGRVPIFLVGKPETDIPKAKLSSRHQMLCFLYFQMHECNKSVRDSTFETATKAMEFG